MGYGSEEKGISRRKFIGVALASFGLGAITILGLDRVGDTIGNFYPAKQEDKKKSFITSEELYADIRKGENGGWLGLKSYKAGDTMRIRDMVRDIGYDNDDDTGWIQLPEGKIYVFDVKNLPESLGIAKGDEIEMTVPVLGPGTGLDWYKGYHSDLKNATEFYDFLDTQGLITVKKI